MIKSKILILLIFTSFCFIGNTQCPTGNLVFTTQNEINQFAINFPNCTNLLGSLSIQDQVTDISALNNIESIQGDLSIRNTSITTISLNNLITVTGERFEIWQNDNLQRVTVNNLSNFNGFLNIWLNSNIQQIEGFDNITEVKSLGLSSQPNLTSIPQFSNLRVIEGQFSITEDESLVSFSGFEALTCVEDMVFNGNDTLQSIPEFNNLTNVDIFRISFNSQLTGFTGFQNLETVGFFIIQGNGGNVTSSSGEIPSFNTLKRADFITISSMGINQFSGFENLETLRFDLDINNIGATSITGFQKLRTARDIDISENFLLESISGFNQIETNTGDLRFFNNNSLETITGFNRLRTIGTRLFIGANPLLENLDFLSQLMVVGNGDFFNEITIDVNTNLNDCSGISNLLNYGTIPADIQIELNGINCSAISTIITNGDNDNDGVLDSVDVDDDNDGILDVVEQNGNPNLDTDFDLLPDHLDINSDNDGCLDVIEAGFTDPDGNGTLGNIPDTVEADGSISGEIDGYSTPLDTDLNLISDFQDFGLSPVIQTQPPLGQNGNVSETITISSVITNADTFQWQVSTDDGQNWIDIIDNGTYVGATTQNLSIQNLDLSFSGNLYRLGVLNSLSTCNTFAYTNFTSLNVFIDLPNAGTDNALEICQNAPPVNLFDLLGTNATTGGIWQPELSSGTNLFDPTIDLPGFYTYLVSDGACFRDTATITISIVDAPDSGDQTDLSFCASSPAIDIFQLLNGTPDASGTWNPQLASGSNIFNPATDSSGLYQYTVTNSCGASTTDVTVTIDNDIPNAGEDTIINICVNGGDFDIRDILSGNPDMDGEVSPALVSNTTVFNPLVDSSGFYTYTVSSPNCGDDISTIEVIVNDLPNAGDNLDLELCEIGEVEDVFALLQGNPDSGGVWSPSFVSNDNTFDPSVDSAGTYTYTVSNSCGSDTSEINIAINRPSNAGENNEIFICESAAAINLFDFLGGNPDFGGSWSPTLASNTGVFNPQLDFAGSYTYTISNTICGNTSAEVLVNVIAEPNPGLDTEIELCVNELPFNIFEELEGQPDENGTWIPALTSGGNFFDPQVDGAGVYTYSVENDTCGSFSSSITVTTIDTFPITDYQIVVTELSDNNSIEIIINNDITYEYSINGINYQLSNTFNNLQGGTYTINVREINGCGRLVDSVFLLDYPLFFTPNGDGTNDDWFLRGVDDEVYSINIFDRYGKLLTSLNNLNCRWDGTYNGKPMPTNDYWFQLTFQSGITKSGHFTLKR
ncbi:T9SS type B sorting domain-containing protein [Winogradskyella sp.]|uniref:T9SS type B sorting domain-containing protein n=1 Tax=Winogradskyella sp. TaxID=1883156 RepID=UPI00260812FB|nr:T9SS type B sorting domain-containing protein [Winogradskyella sp.]